MAPKIVITTGAALVMAWALIVFLHQEAGLDLGFLGDLATFAAYLAVAGAIVAVVVLVVRLVGSGANA